MSTTSTVVSLRAALVTALEAARSGDLANLQISRRWPGPDTEAEGIYLGAAAGSSEIASLKAGRQHRNERFQLEVILQAWRAAETPDTADLVELRLWEMKALLENVLADTPTVGVVEWAEVSSWEDEIVPFESGWRGRLTVVVTATSRLT